jgi:myosin heavy subunit
MSEEVELMLLADVRSLESEVGRMAKRLAEATVKHVSLKAEHERACRERDTLIRMLVSEFEWSDTSYLHAMMHVENAIRNLRAEARAAQAERDEATIKLKFIETEYEKANASELTRDALALQNAALVARCETLRELADSAAAEQGFANRRMMEAQAARDQLREELARLHRIAPTGTYTVSLPHEQEIQRLQSQLEKESAERHNALIKAETYQRELERTKEVIAKLAEQRDHWCDMSRIRLAEADEMRECLRWYVKNDDTMRGGRWEEANEPWLAGKRRAMRALGIGEDE